MVRIFFCIGNQFGIFILTANSVAAYLVMEIPNSEIEPKIFQNFRNFAEFLKIFGKLCAFTLCVIFFGFKCGAICGATTWSSRVLVV